MYNKDCIAMLLAGGEGRRLAPLTSIIAKPAVPFGGSYRIIDFPLSNCVNSGINTIGVLTQYEAESLHQHIGTGEPWGLNSTSDQGITLLPSYNTGNSAYSGTADAIYKNLEYIDQQNPEHVLILSGDHIYYMDYREMLKAHKSSEASATLSVIKVPWAEANRFGVLSMDEHKYVTRFDEKPEQPVSNLASMGIYLFKWSYLKQLLLKDAADDRSSHDFGKDIIPKMIIAAQPVRIYEFHGYWKDVGTVQSLWDSHMDLLTTECEMNLQRQDWPMFTRTSGATFNPLYNSLSQPGNCLVHESCNIGGTADRSVIFGGVEVGQSTRIVDSVIMPNVKIGRNAFIKRAIIGEGAIIKDDAVIASANEIVVIGPHETVLGKPVVTHQAARLLKAAHISAQKVNDITFSGDSLQL